MVSGFFRMDPTSWSLLASNLMALILVQRGRMTLEETVWAFWVQSVAIGFFWFLRLRRLRNFSTEGLKINDKPVPPTLETRNQVSGFFLMHYGGFHACYAVFLAMQTLPKSWTPLLWISAAFIASQASSRKEAEASDDRAVRNLGTMMFFPYIRILPMHIFIMAGSFKWVSAPAAFFLVFKTLADLGMYFAERANLQSPPQPAPDAPPIQ